MGGYTGNESPLLLFSLFSHGYFVALLSSGVAISDLHYDRILNININRTFNFMAMKKTAMAKNK